MTKQQQKQQNKKTKTKSNPVSFSPRLQTSRPPITMSHYNGRDLIVNNLSALASFGLDDYLINPRIPTSFPGCSLMAQRYDMYQFEELCFRFHPTAAVTTSPGVVFLAWEPNANQADLNALASNINAMEHHSEGPIYSPNIVLKVPKSALGPKRYCRSGPVLSDLNLYDTGRLIIARDACNVGATPIIGYVEVVYKIRFFNYHLEEPTLVQNRCAELTRIGTAQGVATGVPSLVDWNAVVEDFGGWESISVTAGTFPLPRGMYKFEVYLQTYDNTSELFTSNAAILKNGSALSVPANSTMKVPPTGSDQWCNHILYAIVQSDGNDTFSTQVTSTGAAGVLDIRVGSRLIITALS